MKTPMQELIETFKEIQKDQEPYFFSVHKAIELAESMLEKEKEMIIKVCEIGDWFYSGEKYYNQVFKTKER